MHGIANPRRLLVALAWTSAPLVFLCVYLPAVGQGFISDDFGWISESQIGTYADMVWLFAKNQGFYRPLVSLSFGLNYSLLGMNPLGYGLTNLALCLLCAMLAVQVFRRLGLSPQAACFGAAVWILNFHGINMALLWVSGRTALLLIAAALAAALATLARRPLLVVVCVAIALLAKEEAVTLPAILLSWMVVILKEHKTREGRRRMVLLAFGCAVDLVVYAVMRGNSGAMTPLTAPSYYQLSTDPILIVRNVLEYLDRACTFALGVSLVAWLILRSGSDVSTPRRSIILGAAIWYLLSYAITTFVPSRSSLYACFPSVAAALVAAEFCSGLWNRASHARQSWALAAMVVIPVLLFPAYVARNKRWTDLASFSQRVLDQLTEDARRASGGSWVVLVDEDRSKRVNLQSAFGSLIGEAVSLRAGQRLNVWVEPRLSVAEIAGMRGPCAGCETMTRVVSGGVVLPSR